MSKADAVIVDNRGKFVLGMGEILGAVSIDGGPVRIDSKLEISSLSTLDVVAITNVRSYNVAALQDSLRVHGLSIVINNGDLLPTRSHKSARLASEALRNNQIAIVPESEYAASKKRAGRSASSAARLTKN